MPPTYLVQVYEHPEHGPYNPERYILKYCSVHVMQELARAISLTEVEKKIRMHRFMLKLLAEGKTLEEVSAAWEGRRK